MNSGINAKLKQHRIPLLRQYHYEPCPPFISAGSSSVRWDNYINFIGKSRQVVLIERTSGEVIIRLPASVDTTGLQRLVDYLTYKEATSNSKVTQEQVDKLAIDVKKGWWKKNRKRFLK
jgi:hypothetical protein